MNRSHLESAVAKQELKLYIIDLKKIIVFKKVF